MKVLFITSTRLGDAVLSTGLLDYLLCTYPDAKVTVACGPLPQSIFEGFPNVEKIIPLKKEKRHGHWIKLWKQVIGTKWDMVIDLRDSAVSRLIWADKRYIFGKHIDKSKHKVEQAAATMKLSEVPAPKLYFTPAQEKVGKFLIPHTPHPITAKAQAPKLSYPSLLSPASGREGGGVGGGREGENSQYSPVIAIGPSANWIGKTWEAEKFIALIEWMTSEDGILPHARVAVFAAPGEEEQANKVLYSIPEDRRLNGIARGNPAEVAAALARCNLYVGNDSGLMHAAAACGVPTIGVFGPSYPHLYRPWGDHTAYARTPETFDELIDFEGYAPEKLDRTLMSSLSVEDVKKVVAAFGRTSKK